MSGKRVVNEMDSSWSAPSRGGASSNQPDVASPPESTYFSAGCSLRGELDLVGRAEINASCEGAIRSDAELTIGESAEIHGDITGSDVRVFGRVAGDIVCSARLELHAGARVTGSITSPRVVMHDGVVFEGECKMPEGQQSIAQPATSTELVND